MTQRRSGAREPGAYFSRFVEGRRGEILEAALEVFAERGYDGGTMREIANRVGVTEPALYRHYSGKEAIFEDLVTVAGDHLASMLGSSLREIEPASARESLHGLIELRRSNAPEDRIEPIIRTLFTSTQHNAAFREALREHLALPMVEALRAFIPRMDAHFHIERTPDELASKVRAFLSLFVGYFMTGMMLELPDDDDAAVDALFAIAGWTVPTPGKGVR